MLVKSRLFNAFIALLLVINLALANVSVAFADDGTPTEPTPTVELTEDPATPPVTETATPEPDVTETPTPEETATPTPEETAPSVEETPLSEEPTPPLEEAEPVSLLSQLPENTDIIVLDQSGESIPLVSEDALNAILDTDPMWCPAGVLPGGAGCTTNFASITLLLTDMRNNTLTYDQDGIIYFTVNPGASFTLTTAGTSLGSGDFNTLNDFNLTLQGGWNGLNGGSATFTAQTNFGTNTLTIGTSSNPWVGNITLNNFTFSGVSSSNSVTVYTTSGNITLNNVDVAQQAGGNHTALLDSNSGNITVQNGSSFDGNSSGGNSNQNRGFSADTSTGTITITNTTFSDARGCLNLFIVCVDALTNYNGATLSAPTVTLTNVSANNNDLNGIQINNASSVTLNNVTATNNGTVIVGSGVNINGTGSTLVNINGGTFSNNDAYGISVFNGSLNVQTPIVACTGNTLGCTNDNVPPVLSLPGNLTTQATGPAGATVTFSATATDNVDGTRTVTCTPASGSTFAITTTTVNCSASDTRGNTANGSFTITVQDTTPPTLNLPANITTEATSSSGATATYSASASDLVDGSVSVTCSPASGSTFPVGVTSVNCSATDSRSNTANGSFTVTVTDTTAPVLTLPANMSIEATSPAGAPASFSVTSIDIVDGAVAVVCAPASGSTFPVGLTSVNCSATDSHSNTANGSFTITVTDTTAPVLTLPANISLEATGALGAIATFSATSSDIVDGSVAVICAPASGTMFAIGTTTVNCSATDSHTNTASGSFTITVTDTTAPVLTLPANISREATGSTGATATFSASSSDIVDGSVPVVCSPASGTMFAIGTTIVNCSATDSHSNSANGSFTVTVQDTTGPIINPHTDVFIETTEWVAVVPYASPAVFDIVDGASVASCSPASGTIFPLGDTLVTCAAKDSHGNSAVPVSFLVMVRYVPAVVAPSTIKSSGLFITVTGGELIDLGCFTVINAFSVKVSFHNLCDHQAIVTSMEENTLPGQLPGGATFVKGLNVNVLSNGRLVNELPTGSGVQLDFPVPANTQDQFAVLLWDGENKEWLDVTQLMKDSELTKMLSTATADGLYQIVPTETLKAFYRILTTEKTGTFVIVKK